VARTPRDEAREARNGVYRQHILEAAEQVFAERGYDAAKVQEISVRAGLSMGVIYGIFPGKTELYTALLDERGQELLRLAREVAGRELSPTQQLFELIDVYVGYFVTHPDFLRMHLRSGVSWALGSAIGTATSVQYWQDIHELQADIFRRGVAAGEFVDEAPDYLARTFSVMDQVLLSDWVARGMTDDQTMLVARLSRMVQRAFCVG
jgi:AcrR family transcriptional regulator